MSSVDNLCLGELADMEIGFAFKSNGFSPDGRGVRLLRGDNIAQGVTRWDRTEFWPANSPVSPRYFLREGDVVLAMDRPWIDAGLKFARIREPDLPAYLVQRVARLRAKEGFDQGYLACVIASKAFTEYILSVQTGTAVPHISGRQILEYRLPRHSLVEQQGIAEVLGALDDKIAANTKLTDSAAELATTEFSKAYRNAARSSALSELVSTQYGVTTSAHDQPGPKFLRVTDINKKPWIEWDSTPNCTVSDVELSKYRVSPGDILVARMADPGKAAYIDSGDPEAVFASYLVRLKPRNPAEALYIYYFLRSPRYQEYAEGAMSGSVQKNMNAKVIVGTDIDLLEPDLMLQFNKAVTPLRKLIQSHLAENRKLAATREVLLPQLMAGKIRVREAEKALEHAGV